MQIIAIKQIKSGKNVYFITNEYNEYDLEKILELGERGVLENVLVISTNRGKKYLRSKANRSCRDNLEKIAITCNEKDYLLFDRKHLYLKTINGRIKRKWRAYSGMSGSTIQDQNKKDFGPLPEGKYIASFDKTLDYKNNTGLWDTFRWLWNYPAWGFVATPLEPSSKNQMYGRGNFYIHGGNSPGSKGCIDLVKSNQEFHCFMRLYKRNLKVIVRYK